MWVCSDSVVASEIMAHGVAGDTPEPSRRVLKQPQVARHVDHHRGIRGQAIWPIGDVFRLLAAAGDEN